MERFFFLAITLVPIFYIFQGLTTGEIIVHGYNWKEKRYNRANRDTQPTKFWAYIIFYVAISVLLVGLSLFGDLN